MVGYYYNILYTRVNSNEHFQCHYKLKELLVIKWGETRAGKVKDRENGEEGKKEGRKKKEDKEKIEEERSEKQEKSKTNSYTLLIIVN